MIPVILVSAFAHVPSVSAPAVTASRGIVIETRILAPDPQAGMKSRQKVTIDVATCTATNAFETGTTDFFGARIGSMRNRFVVQGVKSTGGAISLRVSGETASGVGVVPNINYEFEITLRQAISVTGCHDGYPAYTIKVDDKIVYSFDHKPRDMLSLFGSCDIKVEQ